MSEYAGELIEQSIEEYEAQHGPIKVDRGGVKIYKIFLTYHRIGGIIKKNRQGDKKMNKKIWSVQLADDWRDDTFNGTYEECVEWCKKNDYKINRKEARLAKILVDENGSCLEALEYVDNLDGEDE